LFYFFFFFSSRRRHTRSYGDWSSDVCSSDLVAGDVALVVNLDEEVGVAALPHPLRREFRASEHGGFVGEALILAEVEVAQDHHRSEERRVGKECRSRR